MTAYVYTTNPATPDFQFDITENYSEAHRYTPSKRPVENTGNVVDHVFREPFTVQSNGFVAVTAITGRTYQPIPPNDQTVMVQAKGLLQELADRRDFVTFVSEFFTGQVVITSLEFSQAVSDGLSLKVAISFQEVELAVPQTTQVPPSRLRPKVNKRAPTKGGQKAAKQGKKPASTAARILDKLRAAS